MDCGNTGHILVSKRVADDLEHYPQWRSLLHELGECEVKHGLRISLLNLYGDETGNPELPEKFRQAKAETAPGPAPAKSVAVLPYVNMSADKHDEYLSDGMTEELINALAKVPGLRVPGRTSCFANQGQNRRGHFPKSQRSAACQVGEPDRAIAALQKVLAIPYEGPLGGGQCPLTPALLRLDPMFDPLRDDPRFQRLAASPAPK